MKHKVAELEGALLDAAVALAEGFKHHGAVGVNHRTNGITPWCLSGCNDWWSSPEGKFLCGPCQGYPRQYSSDWSEGGPIIEREGISSSVGVEPGPLRWLAWHGRRNDQTGPTNLVASMRCYVVKTFGHEVDL